MVNFIMFLMAASTLAMVSYASPRERLKRQAIRVKPPRTDACLVIYSAFAGGYISYDPVHSQLTVDKRGTSYENNLWMVEPGGIYNGEVYWHIVPYITAKTTRNYTTKSSSMNITRLAMREHRAELRSVYPENAAKLSIQVCSPGGSVQLLLINSDTNSQKRFLTVSYNHSLELTFTFVEDSVSCNDDNETDSDEVNVFLNPESQFIISPTGILLD